MDSAIVFSLILAVLFLGAIVWLSVYSNMQSKKEAMKSRPKPHQESQSKNRAA